MTESSNAFEAAARALADVRALILSGQELESKLGGIASGAKSATEETLRSISAEAERFRSYSDAALVRFGETANAMGESGELLIRRLEASGAETRAEALKTIAKINDEATTAVKRVVAEVVIARDGVEKAAVVIAQASAEASSAVTEVASEVKRAVDGHRETLERTLRVLEAVAGRYESATRAIELGRQEIQGAQQRFESAARDLQRLEASIRLRQTWLLVATIGAILTTVALIVSSSWGGR